MPRAGYNINSYASIELDEWQAFEPGDTVTGAVVNASQIPGGIASVTLRLVGRAKVKFAVKQGHATRVYRNRFSFFDEADSAWVLSEAANNGAASAKKKWHFQAQIPKDVSPSAIAASNKEAAACDPPATFFPPNGTAKPNPGIPDVFHATGYGLSCFVEYYFHAEIKSTKAASYTATVPLLVYSPASQGSLAVRADYKFIAPNEKLTIHTLAPKPETSHQASFAQRAKASLSRSKHVESKWKLYVACPRQLQIGSPISFLLWAEALDTDAPPPVKLMLEDLRMTIKATTTTIFPGTFKARKIDTKKTYSVNPELRLLDESSKIYIPTEKGAEPIDAGKALDLILHDNNISYRRGLKRLMTRQPFDPKLSPTMATYCIMHVYEMTWDLQVKVYDTDKIHKMRFTTPLQIDGPSRQTMEQALAALSEEEKRARFKTAMKAAGLGLEGVKTVLEIVQAFS